jgi:hypothetical protein
MENIRALLSRTQAFSEKFIDQYIFVSVCVATQIQQDPHNFKMIGNSNYR